METQRKTMPFSSDPWSWRGSCSALTCPPNYGVHSRCRGWEPRWSSSSGTSSPSTNGRDIASSATPALTPTGSPDGAAVLFGTAPRSIPAQDDERLTDDAGRRTPRGRGVLPRDRQHLRGGPPTVVALPALHDRVAHLDGPAPGRRGGGWNREPFTSDSRMHVSMWEKPEP
jgi:hypothetical protein